MDDGDAARVRHAAVAALIDGDIDDNGARGHLLHRFLHHQDGCLPARNQRAQKDDVHALDDSGKDFPFMVQPFLRQGPGVTAAADGNLRGDAEFHELRAEALGLLGGIRPDVAGMDHRSQPFCGGDGLQSGDARAHDQDVDGFDHAHRGKNLRREFGQGVYGHQHPLIARAGAHGGEGVHSLRP